MQKPSLGLAGHFQLFITDYATQCLTNMTKKNVPFSWTKDCDTIYQSFVSAISSNPIPTLPDFRLPFKLNTCSSYYGEGAVLYHRDIEAPKSQQQRSWDIIRIHFWNRNSISWIWLKEPKMVMYTILDLTWKEGALSFFFQPSSLDLYP